LSKQEILKTINTKKLSTSCGQNIEKLPDGCHFNVDSVLLCFWAASCFMFVQLPDMTAKSVQQNMQNAAVSVTHDCTTGAFMCVPVLNFSLDMDVQQLALPA